MTFRHLARLFASNGARRAPKIAAYDSDQDGDSDALGLPDIDVKGDAATLYVYDVIGGWDMPETESLVRQIAGLSVTTIHVRINSPGGLVFEATAIKAALDAHPAKKIVHIDGLAASAASFLMLAGDEIEIAPGGFVMIHNPATVVMADADEMRATADMLDKIRDAIVGQYAAKTGLDTDALAAMMSAETWLSATEAVAQGFVDTIAAKAPRPMNTRRFDLSAYAHPPAALLAPAPDAASDAAAATALSENLAASRARAEQRLRLYAAR